MLLGGLVLRADLIVFIKENADESIGKLKIGDTQVCGYPNTPNCVIPIPIDTRIFNARLDGTYKLDEPLSEISDSFTIEKGLPGNPGFHGMTAFSSGPNNDQSCGEIEQKTFDTNPKIALTIQSLEEPPGTGFSPTMNFCSVPEISLSFPLSVCLIGLRVYASRRRKAMN